MSDQNGTNESGALAISRSSAAIEMVTEPVEIRHLNGGLQAIFRFPNGFGASVVNGPHTYGGTAGLWELAVTKWTGGHFELTYDTDITKDVIGHLAPAELDALLLRIKNLDEDGREPQEAEVSA